MPGPIIGTIVAIGKAIAANKVALALTISAGGAYATSKYHSWQRSKRYASLQNQKGEPILVKSGSGDPFAPYVYGMARVEGYPFYPAQKYGEQLRFQVLSRGECEGLCGYDGLTSNPTIVLNGDETVICERITTTGGDTIKPITGSKYRDAIEIREFFLADGSQGSDFRRTDPLANYNNPQFANVEEGPWQENYFEGGSFVREAPVPSTNTPAGDSSAWSTGFPVWSASHRVEGYSWIAIKLTQQKVNDEYVFQGRWPSVEVIMLGRKIAPYGSNVKTWSNNAARVRYDYMKEIHGYTDSQIDQSAYNSAVTLCGQTIDTRTMSQTTLPEPYSEYTPTFSRYTIDGVFYSNESPQEIEDQFDLCWAGEVVEFGGKLFMQPGTDGTAIATITQNNLVDEIPLVTIPFRSINERDNAVQARMLQSGDHSLRPIDLPLFKDNAAITRDKVERIAQIEFRFVRSAIQAAWLQKVNLLRLRNSDIKRFTISPGLNFERYGYKPGDFITLTFPEHGINARKYQIETIAINEDATVTIEATESFTDTYDVTLGTDGRYRTTLAIPPLPIKPFEFTPLQPLPSVSGINTNEVATVLKDGSIQVTFNITYDNYANVRSQVRTRVKGTTSWEYLIVSEGSTKNTARLYNPIIGQTYESQIRHFSNNGQTQDWTNVPDDTIDGDLTPPSDLGNFAVSSLPQGIHAQWENPTENDFAGVNVYISEQSNFTANQLTLAGALNATFFERFGYIAGRRYYVKARAFDNSGNLGRLTPELSVVPTVQAGEGVQIFSGPNPPAQTLGQNDDLYLQLNGNLWQKQNNAWVNTGIDLTAEGAILFSFNIASTETVPRPMPDITAPVGSIAFNTANGQYWERTDATTWTYRGDLTGDKGDKGDKGSGWIPHLTNTVPSNSIGENDDYIVRPDGIWYIKINGVWTQQGDLTGSDGSKWFTYQGSAAPPSTTFNSVQANIGDFALSTNTGRYYELTGATTWTLRGDLSAVAGSKFVFFTAPIGTNPSLHITQAQANIGDEALNTTSAELWEKTASPNTWMLRGDLGERITRITTNDPPTFVGMRIGDLVFADVNSRNRKLYAWEIADGDTTASWVFKGYFRGHALSVDDSVPSDAITGDVYWDDVGDIKRRKEDGTDENVRTVNREPIEGGGDEVDQNAIQEGCRVLHGSEAPPPNSVGANGDAFHSGNRWFRKINGVWVEQSPRLYTTTFAYIYKRESLPTINYNTEGWRALNPAASRPSIVCILFPSTEAWDYNYETDTWTRLFKMCAAASSLPSAPTNFRNTGFTYPSATRATAALSWNTSSDTTAQRLRISPARPGITGIDTINLSAGAGSYNLTGLARGVDYTAYLNRTTATGTSPEANTELEPPLPVAPTVELPNQPVSVTATPSTSVQGQLSVTVNAGAATTTRPITKTVIQIFRNNRFVSGQSKDVPYRSGTGSYTETFTGLASGSNYQVRAYLNNSRGNGQTRNSATFSMPTIGTPTIPTTLDAPNNLSLRTRFNHDDTEDVVMRSNAVAAATMYDVTLSPASAFVNGETLTDTIAATYVTDGASRRQTPPVFSAQLSRNADGTQVTGTMRARTTTAQSALTTAQITVNLDNLASDSTGSGARAVTELNVEVIGNQSVIFRTNATTNTTNLLGLQYRFQRKRGSAAFVNVSPGVAGTWFTINDTTGNAITRSLAQRVALQINNHQANDVYLLRVRRQYSDGFGPETTISFRVQD